MLTREDVEIMMVPQAAHGLEPAAPAGLVVPWMEGTRIADGNKRNLLDNKGIFKDGFKRKSLRGNYTSALTLKLAAGMNFLGWPLLFACGSLTSTADAIAQIKVTNGGTGYTTPPTVTITDANGAPGTGATATAVIVNGKVDRIIVTNPGSGYHTGETTVGFSGGDGAGAAATVVIKNKHVGSLSNTRQLWLLEAGMPDLNLYYRFLDQIVTGLSYAVELEGQLETELRTKGSGKLITGATSIDATPTEVVDQPADHSSWQVLQNGSLSAVIEKLNIGIEIATAERRAQNDRGLISEFKRGSKTVDVGVDTYFESDDLWQDAREGITVGIDSTVYDNDDNAFQTIVPEIDLEPVGPELPGEDGGVMQSFTAKGIKHVSADAPIKWVLFNDTADYVIA